MHIQKMITNSIMYIYYNSLLFPCEFFKQKHYNQSIEFYEDSPDFNKINPFGTMGVYMHLQKGHTEIVFDTSNKEKNGLIN